MSMLPFESRADPKQWQVKVIDLDNLDQMLNRARKEIQRCQLALDKDNGSSIKHGRVAPPLSAVQDSCGKPAAQVALAGLLASDHQESNMSMVDSQVELRCSVQHQQHHRMAQHNTLTLTGMKRMGCGWITLEFTCAISLHCELPFFALDTSQTTTNQRGSVNSLGYTA